VISDNCTPLNWEGAWPMDWLRGEPSLDEVLADPIVHALMQRDGVDAHDLKVLIEDVRRALRRRVVQHLVARRTPAVSLGSSRGATEATL
jgi:hypothetical protein